MRLLLPLLLLAGSARADTFHVATDGRDDPGRDGRTAATAWASVDYACERAPEGSTVRVGSGTFVATRTAAIKNGMTVAGAGRDATKIVASKEWPLADVRLDPKPPDEFLFATRLGKNATIRDLELSSDPSHRVSGAVSLHDASGVTLENLRIRDFRWAGLWLQFCRNCRVSHCELVDASTEKDRFHSGAVRTRWLKECDIGHCVIRSTVGMEYGYKGGGHEKVRIHDTVIDVRGEFALESAHENEYGLEIDHCHFNRCISVPKSGQGDDPNKRGSPFSVRVHHNLLTDSYTVEGPRNHLKFDHNHVRIEKTGGRVYSQHGGENRGPVWIEHNFVENLDRAFVWANRGTAGDVQIRRNTVLCADAGERTAAILDAWDAKRFTGWVARGNVFACPPGKPRELCPNKGTLAAALDAADNVFVNLKGTLPPGNAVAERVPPRGGDVGAEPFEAGVRAAPPAPPRSAAPAAPPSTPTR